MKKILIFLLVTIYPSYGHILKWLALAGASGSAIMNTTTSTNRTLPLKNNTINIFPQKLTIILKQNSDETLERPKIGINSEDYLYNDKPVTTISYKSYLKPTDAAQFIYVPLLITMKQKPVYSLERTQVTLATNSFKPVNMSLSENTFQRLSKPTLTSKYSLPESMLPTLATNYDQRYYSTKSTSLINNLLPDEVKLIIKNKASSINEYPFADDTVTIEPIYHIPDALPKYTQQISNSYIAPRNIPTYDLPNANIYKNWK